MPDIAHHIARARHAAPINDTGDGDGDGDGDAPPWTSPTRGRPVPYRPSPSIDIDDRSISMIDRPSRPRWPDGASPRLASPRLARFAWCAIAFAHACSSFAVVSPPALIPIGRGGPHPAPAPVVWSVGFGRSDLVGRRTKTRRRRRTTSFDAVGAAPVGDARLRDADGRRTTTEDDVRTDGYHHRYDTHAKHTHNTRRIRPPVARRDRGDFNSNHATTTTRIARAGGINRGGLIEQRTVSRRRRRHKATKRRCFTRI